VEPHENVGYWFSKNQTETTSKFKNQKLRFRGTDFRGLGQVLQHVSIACCAECCISYSVWPSVIRWYHVKTTPTTIMRSSLED